MNTPADHAVENGQPCAAEALQLERDKVRLLTETLALRDRLIAELTQERDQLHRWTMKLLIEDSLRTFPEPPTDADMEACLHEEGAVSGDEMLKELERICAGEDQ